MQRNAHVTRLLKLLLIITWDAKMHVVADFGHERLYSGSFVERAVRQPHETSVRLLRLRVIRKHLQSDDLSFHGINQW